MKALIRTDSSLMIGNGHVMRCMVLANSLKSVGVEVVFLSEPLKGNLIAYMRSKGHTVFEIPTNQNFIETDPESPMLEWHQDANSCLNIIGSDYFDWVIVDHYGLDAKWHQIIRPVCRQILVLDDLANRVLDSDALIDPNPGRSISDYSLFTKPSTKTFIGPDFALLKPSFAELREISLSRRQNAKIRHILVSLGGVDAMNATTRVLDALNHSTLNEDIQITVVLGLHSPWRKEIESQITHMSYNTRILFQTEHMPELMCDADIAIGAAGTSALERCCMGLPSLQLILADNQTTAAMALESLGAAITIPLNNDLSSSIQAALMQLLQPQFLQTMQLASSQLVDGLGSQRVVNEVMNVE